MGVVRELPRTQAAGSNEAVANHLRDMADAVEAGDFGNVEIVCLITQSDEAIEFKNFGRAASVPEIFGLLEFAKFQMLND